MTAAHLAAETISVSASNLQADIVDFRSLLFILFNRALHDFDNLTAIKIPHALHVNLRV